ncbi:hypothetical protein HDU88_006008 [Geranomyces variabilis]|nr:hypothetical protein HDU88_006008 [Geranomyces variabilis]
MPASEQSIDLTNERFHRKQVMSKNNSRGGRALPPSQPVKRKPIDAAAALPTKRPMTKASAPTSSQRLPPARPGDSFAAPVCRPQALDPWSGPPAGYPPDNDNLSSSDEEAVHNHDMSSDLEPMHDGSAMLEIVIDSVEQVRELLKTRNVRYIECDHGKVWLVASGERHMLYLQQMTLKVVVDILDELRADRARALDLAFTCSTSGRIVAARIASLLADMAPNIKWSLILPWIDEDCQTHKPCNLPLPDPKPYIQAVFLEKPDKEPTLLLRATDSTGTENSATSPTVSALDILAIFEPPNPYWNKPDRKTAERRELRIAILRKAVDNIEAKKAVLVKRAVEWLERLFGVREGERTFAQ